MRPETTRKEATDRLPAAGRSDGSAGRGGLGRIIAWRVPKNYVFKFTIGGGHTNRLFARVTQHDVITTTTKNKYKVF